MPDCINCSVEDICDECAEGFYLLESECKAYVECTEEEYEEYISDE
jgi:hypothetical protein